MGLIQRLAVIRIGATANLVTATLLHFDEPIRIGERLARQPGDVGVSVLKNRLGLSERRNAASGDDRSTNADRVGTD